MSLDGQIQLLIATIRSKINSLTTAVNGKEPSLPAGGTIASYLRGDKTWQDVGEAARQGSNFGFVKAATTANITLSGEQTVDTVACIAGDVVLVKNQTTPAQNGPYTVATGAWVRRDPWTSIDRFVGAAFSVQQGTQGGRIYRTNTKVTDTLGTTAISYYFSEVDTAANVFSYPSPAFDGHLIFDKAARMLFVWDVTANAWRHTSGVIVSTAAIRVGTLSPRPSQVWFETDTGLTYIYDGSAWTLLANPVPTGGTAAQYLRGDKTWQTLNPTAVGAEPAIATAPTTQYLRGDKAWRPLKTDALSTVVSPTAPSSPQAGQPWFDQSVQIYKVWDGTTWVEPLPSSLYRHQSDSGWITMTNTLTAGGTCRYRVVDGFITVQVDGSATTVSGTAFTIVTAANGIPAAYRPSVQMRSGAYFTAFPGTLTVGADGSITAVQSSGANRSSISGAITYPIV